MFALPLTPSGKLDKKALPEPEWTKTENLYVAPRDALETKLCELWARVLGVERVGVHDNFFALGGHSLTAVKLMSAVRSELGVHIPLASLFQRPTVAQLAQRVSEASPQTAELARVSRDGPLEASAAQQAMWLLERLMPGTASRHISDTSLLLGPVDVTALSKAIDALGARHESLRTRFEEADGKLLQVIEPPRTGWLEVIDLSQLKPEAADAEAARLAEQTKLEPFDLSAGPLWRARLLRLAPQRHVWSMVMHHIITDAASVAIFYEELRDLYIKSPQLAPLAVHYADYAAWHRQWERGPDLQPGLTYWLKELGKHV